MKSRYSKKITTILLRWVDLLQLYGDSCTKIGGTYDKFVGERIQGGADAMHQDKYDLPEGSYGRLLLLHAVAVSQTVLINPAAQ